MGGWRRAGLTQGGTELERFSDRLAEAILAKKSTVCVGLDPVLDRMPPQLVRKYRRRVATIDGAQAVALCFEEFCRGIIEAVADVVPVVKPQAAFFEQYGAAGWSALRGVIDHAHEHGLLVVLDVKRGDIAATAEAYARAVFDGARGFDGDLPGLGADAVTLSPYLGADSLAPFLQFCERGKGAFVLARTSNPGAQDLQEKESAGRPLFLHVADLIDRVGRPFIGEHGLSDVGAVAGATAPGALRALRAALPHAFFLVPGLGAQGGRTEALAGVADERGLGLVANASRSIIYAWQGTGEDYRTAAAAAAAAMRDQLARIA